MIALAGQENAEEKKRKNKQEKEYFIVEDKGSGSYDSAINLAKDVADERPILFVDFPEDGQRAIDQYQKSMIDYNRRKATGKATGLEGKEGLLGENFKAYLESKNIEIRAALGEDFSRSELEDFSRANMDKEYLDLGHHQIHFGFSKGQINDMLGVKKDPPKKESDKQKAKRLEKEEINSMEAGKSERALFKPFDVAELKGLIDKATNEGFRVGAYGLPENSIETKVKQVNRVARDGSDRVTARESEKVRENTQKQLIKNINEHQDRDIKIYDSKHQKTISKNYSLGIVLTKGAFVEGMFEKLSNPTIVDTSDIKPDLAQKPERAREKDSSEPDLSSAGMVQDKKTKPKNKRSNDITHIANLYEISDGGEYRGGYDLTQAAEQMKRSESRVLLIDLPADKNLQKDINAYFGEYDNDLANRHMVEIKESIRKINADIEQAFRGKYSMSAARVNFPALTPPVDPKNGRGIAGIEKAFRTLRGEGGRRATTIKVVAIGMSSDDVLDNIRKGQVNDFVEKNEEAQFDNIKNYLKQDTDKRVTLFTKSNVMLPGEAGQTGRSTLFTRLNRAGLDFEIYTINTAPGATKPPSPKQTDYQQKFDQNGDHKIDKNELKKFLGFKLPVLDADQLDPAAPYDSGLPHIASAANKSLGDDSGKSGIS